MEMISYIAVTAVMLLFGLLFIGGLFRSVTVYEYERGLKYRHGRFVEVLGPGRYRFLSAYTEVRKVDASATWGQAVNCGVPYKTGRKCHNSRPDPDQKTGAPCLGGAFVHSDRFRSVTG